MKLIYRGTTYNYNSEKTPTRPFGQVREAGSAYKLNYRGVAYRVNSNTKQSEAPVKPAAYELIYRGMTYWVNRNEQEEVTAITSSANPSKDRMTTAPSSQKPFAAN